MDLFITNTQNHLFKITLEFLENLEEMIHRHHIAYILMSVEESNLQLDLKGLTWYINLYLLFRLYK